MLYRAYCRDNIAEGNGTIRFSVNQNDTVNVSTLPVAQYCSPFGGGNNIDGAGFFFMPEVGSQVWILEERDDPNSVIWLGSSFYGLAGRQNIPIEAISKSVEPTIRMIKSVRGHKLIFDDRPITESGDTPNDVVLTNGSGSGLIINEADSTRGLSLGFSTSIGGLTISSKNTSFRSNVGAGLYIDDLKKSVALRDIQTQYGANSIEITDGEIAMQSKNGVYIATKGTLKIEPNGGIVVPNGKSGPILLSATKVKVAAADSMMLTASGGNFTVNAGQYSFTGVGGTNFVLDLAVPGVPGLFQGNIVMKTAGGGILLRNGLTAPTPENPVTATTFTNNDALFPTLSGRLGIGDITNGNALLEGRLGGIFISGTPLQLPGTAGLASRAPAPLAPITPTNAPGGVQSAVLGGNLYQLLTQLTAQLQALLNIVVTSAPTFATSPVGPCILSPAVVTGVTTLQTALTTLQNTYYSPTPLPTNVLSSVTFID